jgi:hypothetical protein
MKKTEVRKTRATVTLSKFSFKIGEKYMLSKMFFLTITGSSGGRFYMVWHFTKQNKAKKTEINVS